MDGSRSYHNNLIRSIRRSLSNTHTAIEDVSAEGTSRNSQAREDDEEALKWAAIEKLPTYDRLRTSIINSLVENDGDGIGHDDQGPREVDVRKFDLDDRQRFINAVFKVAEEDNEKFLKRFKNRLDRVGIQLPRVEVRYEHLNVEAETYVGSRALPTLLNTTQNIAELSLAMLGIRLSKTTQFSILKDISGIIKPSRMTLLLGPPSSGKTTLLLALAGKLDPSLKFSGEVSYNGYKLNEFVPQKTSAYISQNDVHVPEMTVKETLDFSARCQGVGTRYDLLSELVRREKHDGIYPDPEVDLFMKVSPFLEAIPGIPRIKEKQNPATWMMEVSSVTIEAQLGIDFVEHYKSSSLNQKDATELTVILGAMFIAAMFLGSNNCQTVQPIVAIERTIFYRERAAGMYSALPYALAQINFDVAYR
ncbi:hypothetical protein V6N13_148704 [Hibiscus sabdariffa]